MKNMPKVSRQNTIDKEGSSIFEAKVTSSLNLIRHSGNNDFGIDYSAEILNIVKNETTGKFINIQLKSHQSLNFTNDDYYSQSVNVSTANYWLEMNVPVLLVIVDNSSREIYCADVQKSLRENYDESKMNNQQSISIIVYKNSLFTYSECEKCHLNYERYNFLKYNSTDVAIIRAFLSYIQNYSFRDVRLEITNDLSKNIRSFARKYLMFIADNDELLRLLKGLDNNFSVLSDDYIESRRTDFNINYVLPYLIKLVDLICDEIVLDKTGSLNRSHEDYFRLKQELLDHPIGTENLYWGDISSVFYMDEE